MSKDVVLKSVLESRQNELNRLNKNYEISLKEISGFDFTDMIYEIYQKTLNYNPEDSSKKAVYLMGIINHILQKEIISHLRNVKEYEQKKDTLDYLIESAKEKDK